MRKHAGKSIAIFSLALLMLGSPTSLQSSHASGCAGKLGISRTVTLNTGGGARFGASHGGQTNFLGPKEVVLTFDDGPVSGTTTRVLHELKKHCAKATFFMVGRMARNNPELVRKIVNAGHTVGAHSDSHRNLGSTNAKTAIEDVDRSIRSINRAAGRKVAPFFRFPYLSENRAVNAYLKKRDYGVFAIDIDSLDYRFSNPSALVNRVMSELDRKGRGIILLHDIQKVTANGLGELLNRLDRGGYKLVHVKGRGGREISDPVVMASLATDTVEPLNQRKKTRNSAIKRSKKAGRQTRTEQTETRKPKGTKTEKPLITKRQRNVIKERQLAFLQKAKKRRESFQNAIKKRLILQ
ncbi:MAG: polysaccharide deacetylase family protein [Pseudomonadota bacterium]